MNAISRIIQRNLDPDLTEKLVNREVDKLIKALEEIVAWEMPSTGKFHGTGPRRKEYTYSYVYGSNGERRFIRQKAQEALDAIN